MEHEIIALVYAAQTDTDAADNLVRKYLPFIRAEAAKMVKYSFAVEEQEEMSVAMFAFYEAAMAYKKEKGSFLKLASVAIRNRIIDYQRKEARHKGLVSLDQNVGNGEKNRTILEEIDSGYDEIGSRQEQHAAKEEIREYVQQLEKYGLELAEVADNCPRQERTFRVCQKVVAYSRENPALLERLTSTKKLPIMTLADGCGVERKTLERHRKYLVAVLLAFTNGFEIIRGHLSQMMQGKGDKS